MCRTTVRPKDLAWVGESKPTCPECLRRLPTVLENWEAALSNCTPGTAQDAEARRNIIRLLALGADT